MASQRHRAVSTTLGYVLMLSVASLLVVGLLTAGGGFVADQRETVIRTELEVIGQQLASDIAAADRMVEAEDGDPSAVRIVQQRPSDVSGSTYDVTLVDDADPHLELRSANPEVSVTVQLTSTTAVSESTVGGGTVAVVYDPSADHLVIENA